MRLKTLFILPLMTLLFAGCGMQAIPKAKNEVDAAFAEVTNQYKRRADLVPNLVETVKGYAQHEEKTLKEVTEARAKATSINVSPENLTPESLEQYQKAQGELSQALGRLLVVTENYPDLKANENFRDLQAQLEGTENRIAIARRRHIETIQAYNNLVTVPPVSWFNSLFYHYPVLPQWSVSDSEMQQINQAPKVNF